jgi:ubiquitin-protein ligase
MAAAKGLARLSKELRRAKENRTDGISVYAINDDLRRLGATISGPAGTPYEGGEFRISITIKDNYPFSPPNMKFDTKIFHPNIDVDGQICLPSLKEAGWNPSNSIEQVLLQIQVLMGEPNDKDPLNAAAAAMHQDRVAEFRQEAAEWTRQYAKAQTPKGPDDTSCIIHEDSC